MLDIGEVFDRSDTLAVSEIFGPTVQGEGPNAGRHAKFLRLMGCNLHCSWCDTAYTWDADNYNLKKETKKLSTQECAQQLNAIDASLLVISGGEPLLQQKRLDDLFPRMPAFVMGDLKVEVETNGTIVPMWPPNTFQLRFNVSPKLSHADDGRDPYSKRVIPSVLEELGKRWDCRFKFVVSDPSDEYEILDIVKSCGLNGDHVWLMPLGTEVEQLNQSLQVASEIAIRNKWNLTDRMHIRIWDGKRGH